MAGHVFLSYVREDSRAVDRLQEVLESAGIRVWRDTAELWPGEDWRARIRSAITSNALVFIACFSPRSVARAASYQNEELTLAVEEMRLRPPDQPWLIPVRLDDCEIPYRDIGAGRTLHSLHRADLFGFDAAANADRLVTTVRRILGLHAEQPVAAGFSAEPAPGPSAASHGQAAKAAASLSGRGADVAEPIFGIITALPEEFLAMRAMIDDPRRRNVAPDRADYVLGTMPGSEPSRPHAVVLTLLGETGNDAASSGCANLIRSFGSVRCVLMVGIAAGVPSRQTPSRHVRLGDIVVARWGIVEYDSVAEKASGPVPRRTFPPASPLLERRARMLEVGEIAGARPWEEMLAATAEHLPGFGRPAESTDVLYACDETDDQVPHPDVTMSGHRPGWPKVHCGVIASGDRSLRSAGKRDAIAATAPDVLAIEMEGKGIGNTGFSEGVEWLVIRGISDYGDQHVSRLWRNYAALAAAAYTRALLAECPPLTPARQSDLLSQPSDGAGGPGIAAAERGVAIGGASHGIVSTGDNATVVQIQIPGGASGASGSLDDQYQRLAAAMSGQRRRATVDQRLTGSIACAFTSHTKAVLAVEFSPDGSMLATASEDMTARLWHTATGTPIRTLVGHTGAVNSAAFSPDGSMLATASEDMTARLWHTATGTPARTLVGHTAAVWKVAISPDGSMLASASYDHTARLWLSATGTLVSILTGHDGPVLGITFSPALPLIATASEDRTARLWHAGTGAAIATLDGHAGRVWKATFSPDASLLATVSEDKTARLWDTATGALVTILTGHDGDVHAAAFSPDGSLLATASEDKTARLWDTATGALVTILTGHDGDVHAAAFSPDGSLLATASEDKTARLWDTTTGAPVSTLSSHASSVWLVAFSPDGSLLATADDEHIVRLWEQRYVQPMTK